MKLLFVCGCVVTFISLTRDLTEIVGGGEGKRKGGGGGSSREENQRGNGSNRRGELDFV